MSTNNPQDAGDELHDMERQIEQSLEQALSDGDGGTTSEQEEGQQEEGKVVHFRSYGLVGSSNVIRQVQRQVALFGSADCPVLITGETGVGKELVAEALHRASPRHGKIMKKANCAAVAGELVESHLFGHEQGAFTGAFRKSQGLFGNSHRNTLFFDEIGDMPPNMQARVLRAFQDGEVQVVGGESHKVDVRLIFATNRNLAAMVKAGQFRQDLYYRVNGLVINIPPLRERRQDIPLLAITFLNRYIVQFKKKAIQISAEAMEFLMQYQWPGNVRELENVIRRAVLVAEDSTIKRRDLKTEDGESEDVPISTPKEHVVAQGPVSELTPYPLPEEFPTLEQFKAASLRYYVTSLLKRTGGHVSNASVVSGTPRSNFYKILYELGLRKKGHKAVIVTASGFEQITSLVLPLTAMPDELQEAKKQQLLDMLNVCHWNRKKVAEALGVSYKTVLNRVKKFDLKQW